MGSGAGALTATLEGQCCMARDKNKNVVDLREVRPEPKFPLHTPQGSPAVDAPPSGIYDCFFTENGEEEHALYVLQFKKDGSLTGHVTEDSSQEDFVKHVNTDGVENINGVYDLRNMTATWREVFEDFHDDGEHYEMEVVADLILVPGKEAMLKGTYKSSDGVSGDCRFVSHDVIPPLWKHPG
eukprot:TRINITY_DN51071_c0_g1_i1.p1 TRINITY_DN51071_c0_g1~~TRINITY_DN51071_c0_g1_i1.p1  ORF type:complete len:183 (-),score=36.81 TRINITY_DN51071_c0_g1_i1:467-1015(-)